jgi:hypothetical protein
MDILNDKYPLYEEYLSQDFSDSDSDHEFNHKQKQTAIEIQNLIKPNKKLLLVDEWNIIHSDDLWYLWCVIQETIYINNSPLLDRVDYPTYCEWVYRNSTKK